MSRERPDGAIRRAVAFVDSSQGFGKSQVGLRGPIHPDRELPVDPVIAGTALIPPSTE